MNNEGLSAGDILALTKNNDCMCGGGGLWWIIIFFIVAGVFNGGMYGNNANAYGMYDNEFIKRDIFNTNQNVSNTACNTQRDVLDNRYQLGKDVLDNRFQIDKDVLDNRYQIGRDVLETKYADSLNARDLNASIKDCCCTTNRNIDSVRYDNAIGQANLNKDMLLANAGLQKDMLLGNQNLSKEMLLGHSNLNKDMLLGNAGIQRDILLGNQNLQSKLDSCCCSIEKAIHADGEATRALITENKIADLQYQLNQANTAVANAVQTRTILDTIGRYNVVAVPPYTYGYGYGTSSCGGNYGYGYGVSGVV